jgi:hypothetical protein
MADAAHPGGLKGVFKNDTTLKFQSKFKTPGTQRFKLKVKAGAYKFGAFMHWIFFKPDSELHAGEDPAQTSKAPLAREDAGASATDMDRSGHNRTMAATRDMVQGTAPSEQEVAAHQTAKDVNRDRPLPAV